MLSCLLLLIAIFDSCVMYIASHFLNARSILHERVIHQNTPSIHNLYRLPKEPPAPSQCRKEIIIYTVTRYHLYHIDPETYLLVPQIQSSVHHISPRKQLKSNRSTNQPSSYRTAWRAPTSPEHPGPSSYSPGQSGRHRSC